MEFKTYKLVVETKFHGSQDYGLYHPFEDFSEEVWAAMSKEEQQAHLTKKAKEYRDEMIRCYYE